MSINPQFTNEKKVLDHGYVRIVGVMGDDGSPDADARISTGSEARSLEMQKTLVRFLLRHKHTTPFEGCVLEISEVRAPIFVIREWFRHRTFSYNEESGRYKQLDPLYYTPAAERVSFQAESNHQGSGANHPQAPEFIARWDEEQKAFEDSYDNLIKEHNVARELARLNMPVSHYSSFIATGNLLNWFRFLQLRLAPNAQYEIRVFAQSILDIGSQYFPQCFEAFQDYWMDSLSLSGKELGVLKEAIGSRVTTKEIDALMPAAGPGFTKRERAEFLEKLIRLGIS